MKPILRTKFLLLALMALALASGLAMMVNADARIDKVARGKYLVTFGGCGDCHTPVKPGPHGPEPDMSRYLSGHPGDSKLPPAPKLANGPWFAATTLTAWSGPWGVSYASNLTPDRNTGLGAWTERIFIQAMRTGKHYGVGRDILPPMPWKSVAALSDEDISAVYAYLQSIPPIRNEVPRPVPPTGPVSYE